MIKNKSAFSRKGKDISRFGAKAKKKPAKSTRKNTERRKKSYQDDLKLSFTAKLVLGLVAVTFTITGITLLAKEQMTVNEKQRILDDLNTRIDQQVAANEELEEKLNGDLDDYIEDYARDKLDMVKPGEHVYINTVGE